LQLKADRERDMQRERRKNDWRGERKRGRGEEGRKGRWSVEWSTWYNVSINHLPIIYTLPLDLTLMHAASERGL